MGFARMNPLQVRVVVAGVAAAAVVTAAVVFAALDWAVAAAALSIYALGAGAWLYHCIERYVVAKRVNTVMEANRLSPVRHVARPLLPVMAAILGLSQLLVRALSDVDDMERPKEIKPPRRPK